MAKQPLIAVIDGKGGGLGRAVIEALNRGELEGEIIALGTNAVATANMLRGGAKDGASGENAVCHMCRQAKVIVGPIGILTADAMMGEITPRMAQACLLYTYRCVSETGGNWRTEPPFPGDVVPW